MAKPYVTPKPITVPIALSQTQCANLTSPWFVQTTRVDDIDQPSPTDKEDSAETYPQPTAYQYLVNGKDAFEAVHDAIAKAQKTIDIVCWGFQPSMFFKRDGQSPCIGDLLIQKGAAGKIVRVLCWNSAVPTGLLAGENNMPGHNLTGEPQAEEAQRYYDMYWHRGLLTVEDAGLPLAQRIRKRSTDNASLDPTSFSPVGPYFQSYPNLHFKMRGFSLADRSRLKAWLERYQADPQQGDSARLINAYGPTHHQKTVVVDYEDPANAVGFVMGHNMLDPYWDTDEHSINFSVSNLGRNVPTPRQDMSARITGKVLKDLNHNFCTAWQRETGEDLLTARENYAASLNPDYTKGACVMAQILRTQAQEGRRDIKTMYLMSLRNISNFIYLENQYFRWPPLADMLKDIGQRYADGGRDKPLYLFVVTNASDEGMGPGVVNTYRMLNALGRAETIPKVAVLERNDELMQQRRELEEELAWEKEPARPCFAIDADSAYARQQNQAYAAYQTRVNELRKKLDDVNQQIKKLKEDGVTSNDMPGLKVHVCSLVAPDSTPGDWRATYVHSKIAIVDDVFLTHGSANINTRSMEVDSELNICHENSAVTRPLREHLWRIHTNGMGVGQVGEGERLDAEEAHKQWANIIDQNKRLHDPHEATRHTNMPYAPLVEFFWGESKLVNKD